MQLLSLRRKTQLLFNHTYSVLCDSPGTTRGEMLKLVTVKGVLVRRMQEVTNHTAVG